MIIRNLFHTFVTQYILKPSYYDNIIALFSLHGIGGVLRSVSFEVRGVRGVREV